jgi:hypothetical protein
VVRSADGYQDDVRRIALSLPEASETADHFGFGVLNKGKLKEFAWAWRCLAPAALSAGIGRGLQ